MISSRPKVEPDDYYSIGKAAEMLGVHRNTLRGYVMSNKIKPKSDHISGRRFISGSELSRFWNSRFQ